MKSCFKCKIMKPISEFYKHAKMKDGYLNKCKTCTKDDVRKNRETNYDYYAEYDRNRFNAELRNLSNIERTRVKRLSDQDYRDTLDKSKKDWRNRNPDKVAAQTAANNAVRDGIILRKHVCEMCGAGGRIQKHHWSYDKEHWLDIIWLCAKCHGLEHKRLNEIGRNPDNITHCK